MISRVADNDCKIHTPCLRILCNGDQRQEGRDTQHRSTRNKERAAAPNAETQERAEKTEEERKKEAKKMLAKYRGMQHLMNPSVFNMKKVREAKLPSANGHASASALAHFFDALVRPEDPLLSPGILAQARTPSSSSSSSAPEVGNAAVLDDASSDFGLGFQLHNFVRSGGERATSIGHSGVGGSVVLAIPEERAVVALTVNHLSSDCVARQRLLGIVFDELGWRAPPSMPVQQKPQEQPQA